MKKTIQELVTQVAIKARLNKIESRQAVNAVFDTIANILIQQNEVRIPKFGTFYVKKKTWRESRDPRCGKKILAPPRSVPALDFSDFVKYPVNQDNRSLRPKNFQDETIQRVS